MHTFPKNDPQRVQRWMEAINVDISSYKINSYRRVCHLHFPPESYARNLQAELLNYPCRKRLADDAVPSLLLPSPPSKGNKPPVPKLQVKLVEDIICQQPDLTGSERDKKACCVPKSDNRNGTMHGFPSDQGNSSDAVPSLLLPSPPSEGDKPPVPKLQVKLVEDKICQQSDSTDSTGSKRQRKACCVPKCGNRNGTMHGFPSDQGNSSDFPLQSLTLDPPPPMLKLTG